MKWHGDHPDHPRIVALDSSPSKKTRTERRCKSVACRLRFLTVRLNISMSPTCSASAARPQAHLASVSLAVPTSTWDSFDVVVAPRTATSPTTRFTLGGRGTGLTPPADERRVHAAKTALVVTDSPARQTARELCTGRQRRPARPDDETGPADATKDPQPQRRWRGCGGLLDY